MAGIAMPAISELTGPINVAQAKEWFTSMQAALDKSPVKAQTLLSSGQTAVSFTSLDANTDGGYTLIGEINNATGSTAAYRLFVNNDQTTANYTYQINSGISTTLTGSAGTNAVANLQSGQNGLFVAKISISPGGNVYMLVNFFRSDGTLQIRGIKKNATEANITQMDLSADTASGISTNSRLTLLRGVF